METAEKIRSLIAKNNLEKAIETFLDWSKSNGKEDLTDQLTESQRKFANLRRSENMGLLSFSEAGIERAKITNTLLELLKELQSNSKEKQADNATNRGMDSGSVNKILFLASNPSDTGELQLTNEFTIISGKLQDNPKYQLVQSFATTPAKLHETAIKYQPNIIHFSGHGTGNAGIGGRALAPRTPGEPTGIILEDGNGGSRIVSGAMLGEMFSILKEIFKIEMVVLNACYSQAQAEPIAAQVEYVIGMSDSVKDDAAIDFSSAFYRNLAQNLKVDLAFRLAKNEVGMNAFDHSILALYEKGVRKH